MKIERFRVNFMEVNCYVVYHEKEAMVVDPGDASEQVLTYINQRDLKVVAIINTHGHADHIMGNAWFMEKTKAPLWIHEKDAEYLSNPEMHLGSLTNMDVPTVEAGRFLKDGDVINVGNKSLEVMHTPGHSPGGICLYAPNLLISGDTLFKNSVGRWDLPGGNLDVLKESILRLGRLPIETVVYPGHGPSTTIEHEIINNSFL